MYSLSIHFGPSPVPAQFLFKEEEKAGIIYNTYVDFIKEGVAVGGVLIGADSFGQSFAIALKDIHGITIEDMNLGEESRIQRGLSQARGQAKANERAKTDPILLKAMGVRGPSVLTPFGNGQFGNG